METQITHREDGQEGDYGQFNNQSRQFATLDGDDSTVMTFADDASSLHYVSARFDQKQGIQDAMKEASERHHLVIAPSPGLANSRTGRGSKKHNKTKQVLI